MKVRRLSVSQTRIFRSDVLPAGAVLSAGLGNKLITEFGFNNVNPNLGEAGLDTVVFERGAYQLDEDTAVPIMHTRVEPRRISSTVLGTSENADEFHAQLMQCFVESGLCDVDAMVPIAETQDSFCICTLDIDFRRMFSSAFQEFVEQTLEPATVSPYADEHHLLPLRIGYRVTYEAKDSVTSFAATLAEKVFVIEPRAGAGDGEPLYYVLLPASTATLLDVVKELEVRFNSS